MHLGYYLSFKRTISLFIIDFFRRLVGSGDAFPSNWSVKVEKCDYVLKVHVRQEKKELLDRFLANKR